MHWHQTFHYTPNSQTHLHTCIQCDTRPSSNIEINKMCFTPEYYKNTKPSSKRKCSKEKKSGPIYVTELYCFVLRNTEIPIVLTKSTTFLNICTETISIKPFYKSLDINDNHTLKWTHNYEYFTCGGTIRQR